MKKIFNIAFAAAAMSALAVSCQTENLEPQTPQEEAKTVEVIVSLGDQTKGFTDLEGITWEVGDQIKWGGSGEYTSDALTADDISDDGHTAKFKFDAGLNAVNRTGWFVSKTNHTNFSAEEVAFTRYNDGGNNIITQAKAGEMNKNYLFLHSGINTMAIEAGNLPSFNMAVVGSIFRIIPYSTKGTDEKILSVTLSSNSDIVGTVKYTRNDGTYQSPFFAQYQSLTIRLSESFSLSGITSAEKSSGIYMSIPATAANAPWDGYKYIVETDQATYTFDAMSKNLEVGENVVKNVFLNLDKGKRVGNNDFKGYVWYEGQPDAQLNVSYVGCSDRYIGYSVAKVTDADGQNPVLHDTTNADEKYYNAVITYYDADSNQLSDTDKWLTLKLGEVGNPSNYHLTVEPNSEAKSRSAKIVVKLDCSTASGYTLTDNQLNEKEYYEYTVDVTQQAYSTISTITVQDALKKEVSLSSEARTYESEFGYLLFFKNGSEFRDGYVEIYPEVTFTAYNEDKTAKVDWIEYCGFKKSGNAISDAALSVSVSENTSNEARVAIIVIECPKLDADKYVYGDNQTTTYEIKVTQAAE